MDSYFLDEPENQEEEKLDIGRYYRAVRKRWWIVAIVAIVVAVPWFWYIMNQPPVYKAKARIRFNDLADRDNRLSGARTAELTSRTFAEKVVAQLGLSLRMQEKDGKFISRSKIFQKFQTTKRPVPGLYILNLRSDDTFLLVYSDPDLEKETLVKSGLIQDIIGNGYLEASGMTFKLVEQYRSLPPTIEFKVLSFRDAVESFQSRIKVKWEDRASTLMSLSLTDSDPILVADMTNKLAEVLIDESRGLKAGNEQGRVSIIEKQLTVAKTELDESERKLQNFKERYGVSLQANQQSKLNELTALETELDELDEVLTTLKSLLQQKEQQATLPATSDPHKRTLRFIMNQLSNQTAFNTNATILVIRDELSSLEQEWSDIATRTSPANPKAKKKLEEILQVHNQVESFARQESVRLQNRHSNLNGKVRRIQAELRQQPARLAELSQLEREHEVLDTQYRSLLAEHQDAIQKAGANSEDIKVLDPAIPPEFPTNTDKKQMAAIGGAAAIFLGIGLVVVIEVLNKTIMTAEDVKKYLRLPILGTIPQIDFEETFHQLLLARLIVRLEPI